MKKTYLVAALALGALVWGGCASNEHRHGHSQRDGRYYVADEHPYSERDAHRVYVRERNDYRGTPYYQNNMEPRVRGKHAESLGWNTENYYLQRGY